MYYRNSGQSFLEELNSQLTHMYVQMREQNYFRPICNYTFGNNCFDKKSSFLLKSSSVYKKQESVNKPIFYGQLKITLK